MKYLLIISLFLCFISCSSNEENPVVFIESPFEDVTIEFTNGKFADSTKIRLLRELKICDSNSINTENQLFAPCAPSNFKFLSFNDRKELKNSFMLQIKAMSILPGSKGIPLPVRHLMIFERENGQLVKVNGFRGNLIGWREGEQEEKDLMIRFYLPEDQTFVNCTFKWNGGKYEFSNALSLDWGQGDKEIKAEVRDSVSNQIYTDLSNHSLLF